MYQPIEKNTAYCLNCTNEWPPAIWGAKELILVGPRCGWQLGVPTELISSGWRKTWEYDGEMSSMEEAQRHRTEEHRKKRQRARFARGVREDLERLPVIGLPQIDNRNERRSDELNGT